MAYSGSLPYNFYCDLRREKKAKFNASPSFLLALSLQKSMKAEMEMAMKLLEKDVHHKQDTIVCLRDQLEDIKDINLEMYTKLQVPTYT